MSRTAILLLAHGTPDILSDMPEYLRHVTGGRPMPAHVIEELQHRYAAIGLGDEPLPQGPPLTRWTLRQATLLEGLLGERVYAAMRNWHPFIADTVAQMKADGVTHVRVLCLAPQNSRTSTGLYRRALDAALDQVFADTRDKRLAYDFIAGWADEPLLAEAFAERLWPTWAEACAAASATAGKPVHVPVLFTAHSVPCKTILSVPAAPPENRSSQPESGASIAPSTDLSSRPERGEAERSGEISVFSTTPAASTTNPGAPSSPTVLSSARVGATSVPAEGIQDYGPAAEGDPYPTECKQTAAAVAQRLAPVGLTDKDWYFAFQSQGIAGAPWLGPTVEDTLKALGEAGQSAVVVQPIGFLCDHVEILYDIDIHFREIAESLKMKLYRPESLNDSPILIRALAHVLSTGQETVYPRIRVPHLRDGIIVAKVGIAR